MEKNLGHATAYGYAKSKGYSGTEEEFAQLMADYASVGQSAAQSAEQAAASASSASGSAATASQSAQTATSKASEALTAAGTATTKASEASASAGTASTAAQTATDKASIATTAADTATAKASEASESATTATTAKTDAETARDAAAQSASQAAASAESIDPDEFDRKIYAAFATDTASGSIAHFEDGADSIPMKDVLIHIEPVQEGSGDPSPDNVRPITGWTGAKVTRTGRNIWDEQWEKGTLDASTGNEVPSSVTMRSKNLIPVKPGMGCIAVGPYNVTSTNQFIICYYDIDGEYVDYRALPKPEAFTVPNNDRIKSMRFAYRYYLNDSGGTYNHDVSISYPATITTYEPYQGTTYPITFPSEAGTVYGGTLDVTSGELVVDRAQIASYNGEALPSTWISDRDVYASGTTPTIGAQVVYKLASPITYSLTPQEITSLLGDNNVWADAGDTEVTYRADTTLYINRKIAEAVSALS